ncbi:hypothetical protein ACP70R_012166 [Stipagrostis hirtigluma subsp. patula]
MAPTLPAMTKGDDVVSSSSSSAPPPPPPPPRRKRKRTPQPEAEGADAKPAPPLAAETTPARTAKNRPKAPSPSLAAPAPAPEPNRRPPPAVAKRPAPFRRAWPPEDEVAILEALAAHRRDHGRLPPAAALFAALRGRLRRKGVGTKDVAHKQNSLRRRYESDAKKAAPPADDHERRLYLLSRRVWGPKPPLAKSKSVMAGYVSQPESPGEGAGEDATQAESADERAGNDAAQAKSAGERAGNDAVQAKSATGERAGNDAAQAKSAGERAGQDAAQAKSAGERAGQDAEEPKARTLGEMRELYPYLVDEAMVLVDQAELESLLPNFDDSEAMALNSKIKKLREQLTSTITESARIRNMEMPTEYLCPSTKLQPEKFTVENENNLLLEHFDKTVYGICAKERLARVEREIVELRQIVRASPSLEKRENNQRHDLSALKGIRCGFSESALQSIVAENEVPLNKIEATNNQPHGKNEVVTSKYFYDLHRNKKLQRMLPLQGTKIKAGAGSQTPHTVMQTNTIDGMAAHGQPSRKGIGLTTQAPHNGATLGTRVTQVGAQRRGRGAAEKGTSNIRMLLFGKE